MDWSHVDYLWIIVTFLSAVWTLILTAPIHCRGFIGQQLMECKISPNQFWWRNKLIFVWNILRVSTFSANVHFWVNYSYKNKGSKRTFHYKEPFIQWSGSMDVKCSSWNHQCQEQPLFLSVHIYIHWKWAGNIYPSGKYVILLKRDWGSPAFCLSWSY